MIELIVRNITSRESLSGIFQRLAAIDLFWRHDGPRFLSTPPAGSFDRRKQRRSADPLADMVGFVWKG
jgi:hypothetical protein